MRSNWPMDFIDRFTIYLRTHHIDLWLEIGCQSNRQDQQEEEMEDEQKTKEKERISFENVSKLSNILCIDFICMSIEFELILIDDDDDKR